MKASPHSQSQPQGRARPRADARQPESAQTDKAKRTGFSGLDQANLSPDMRAAVMRLIDEVDRLNGEAGQLHARIGTLESLADTDPLLPVFNRRAFTRELRRAMAMAQRHNLGGALVFIDLDGFKEINDTYGHAAGDTVLHSVASILTAQLRETDIVGRLGGDEFGVLLAAADDAGAQKKADSLIAAITGHDIMLGDKLVHIRASAGVYPFSGAKTADALIEAADKAMYACKKARREKPAS